MPATTTFVEVVACVFGTIVFLANLSCTIFSLQRLHAAATQVGADALVFRWRITVGSGGVVYGYTQEGEEEDESHS